MAVSPWGLGFRSASSILTNSPAETAAFKFQLRVGHRPLDGDILLFHVFKSVREDVLRDADVSEAMIRESLASEGFTLVTRMRRSVSGYS